MNETLLMIEIINDNCLKQRKLKEQKLKKKRRKDIVSNLLLDGLMGIFFIGLTMILVIINDILFL